MAINFPDSPTLNQTFQQADRAWQWDGEKWKATGTTSSSTVGATVVFEGATDDAYETTLTATDPTADRTITLPNASGTVAFVDSPTLTGTPAAPTAFYRVNRNLFQLFQTTAQIHDRVTHFVEMLRQISGIHVFVCQEEGSILPIAILCRRRVNALGDLLSPTAPPVKIQFSSPGAEN